MKLSNRINEIIPLLDSIDDLFLIEMLKDKIESNYQSYLQEYSVSDYDLRIAKKGVSVTMGNFAESVCLSDAQQLFNNRIDNIISDCDDCNHSIVINRTHNDDSYSYKSNNNKSDICKSCIRRTDNLMDMKYQRHIIKYDIISKVDPKFLEDHIKIKAIINKLKRKIKDYEAS